MPVKSLPVKSFPAARSPLSAPRYGILVVAVLASTLVRADDLEDARTRWDSEYAERLEELASFCDSRQWSERAEQTRTWIVPRDPDQLCLYVIPHAVSVPDAPAQESDTEDEWQRRFSALRQERAEALFELAQRAAKERNVTLAVQWASQTLRENPDHELARRVFGYLASEGEWWRSYGRSMKDQGHIWHHQFGWIRSQDLARYKGGQRKWNGKWIDNEEEATLRHDIRSGWQVRTEHYLVTTNHSFAAGLELAQRLEQLQQIWRQVFAEYYLTASSAQALFQALFRGQTPLPRPRAAHRVTLFRNREEYIRSLRPAQPRIDVSLGIYFDSTRRAYFFAGDEDHTTTMYHEATHQLFQEAKSRGKPRDKSRLRRRGQKSVARGWNFWIIEGIATYMESLRPDPDRPGEGVWKLGGMNSGRMPAARHRLINDNYYVPLDRLTKMGMSDIQRHPDIAKLYSQFAGLTTFFMHYDQGRYRRPLVKYLGLVYSGKDRPHSLARLTGRSYPELDTEYRQFMAE